MGRADLMSPRDCEPLLGLIARRGEAEVNDALPGCRAPCRRSCSIERERSAIAPPGDATAAGLPAPRTERGASSGGGCLP